MEDLGALTYANWLSAPETDETQLYLATVDVFERLNEIQIPTDFDRLDPPHAAQMITPALDWYATHACTDAKNAIISELETVLAHVAPHPNTFALRDFHAENLIWRPDQSGLAKIGLLDFQDAVAAQATYDVVSLLTDARRDVDDHAVMATKSAMMRALSQDKDEFDAEFAAVSIQRNLRILGIFARLAERDGKTRYLEFMPRVWRHIDDALNHPVMTTLRPLVQDAFLSPQEKYSR